MAFLKAFYLKTLAFCYCTLLLSVIVSSCGESNTNVENAKTDTTSVETKNALAPVDIKSYFDVLFINEGDWNDYYKDDRSKNKTVLQFTWPSVAESKYFTLGLYPSVKHEYTGADAPPVIYLNNKNIGSTISITGPIILGDQQLESKNNKQLKLIETALAKAGNQTIVFEPAYNERSYHVYYKIYVIESSTDTTGLFLLPPTPTTTSDPSPPATATD